MVGWQAAFAVQARSYSGSAYVCERLVGWLAAFAGKPAPTVDQRMSVGDWLAGRSPSRAGPLPQWISVCL
ncbi:hypothetical protein EMIT0P291_40051 [Pseudomonas sp. IT-P291]